MDENFAQGATPIGVLRSILDNYPYSVGLLREILQNSDDAGATTQTFVLDRRNHATDSLSAALAQAQGPAFLAHNNAKFDESNWHSIQAVYESSKGSDSSKIGKYGIGFRSVFHTTDCPQILSGPTFAMFDPLQAFTGAVGKKMPLASVTPAQLAPFSWFLTEQTSDFDGTIVRCPLRTAGSKISSNVVTPDDIARLFKEFISKEAEIVLLFLRKITNIDVYDVSLDGTSTCLLKLSISRSSPISCGDVSNVSIATVTVEGQEPRKWRIVHSEYSQEDASKALFSTESEDVLKEHKLLPHIGIAAPMDNKKCAGRLFTFLPLPLPTGFPVHIHAYFALTQSRQNLRNSQETGLAAGTTDHLFVQWNNLLFDRYIPEAWNILLQVLVKDTTVRTNLFDMWPPQQPSTMSSGESVYWKSLPLNLLRCIITSVSAVWPVFQDDPQAQEEYKPLNSLITVQSPRHDRSLRAMTRIGLRFTCPPRYIADAITKSGQFPILTPEEAHKALGKYTDSLKNAEKAEILCILEYLLSTQNLSTIVGLPIIYVSSGQLVSLTPKEASDEIAYTMLNSNEHTIFGNCDMNAIALHLLPRSVADILRREGPKKLNVAELGVSQILRYLTEFPERLGVDLASTTVSASAVNFLDNFWNWVDTYSHKDELLTQIQHLLLLPSTSGLRKTETPLFISMGEHPKCIEPLVKLGVPFLVRTPTLRERAQRILKSLGLLKSISDIPALIHSLPDPTSSPLAVKIPADECSFILRHLAHFLSGSLKDTQITRLRSLPIYPIGMQDNAAPLSSPSITIEYTSLPTEAMVYYSVHEPPFLPTISDVVFVLLNKARPQMDLRLGKARLLSNADLLDMTVVHFAHQTPYLQAVVLRHIEQHQKNIAPRILEKLREVPFTVALDGSKRKPFDLFAPDAPVTRLYSGDTSRRIRISDDAEALIAQRLASLKLFQHTLTLDIVHEIINKIALQPLLTKSVSLSRTLLDVMVASNLDFSNLVIPLETRWLPTNLGLRGVGECRGRAQSPELFDRIFAVLDGDVAIPPSLAKAFEWDVPVPTGILVRQFISVLEEPQPPVSTILTILNEFGKRELTDDAIGSILGATIDRSWVPTADRKLARTGDAVFLPAVDSGFHQIYPVEDSTKALLQRLGCTESPSPDAVLAKLENVSHQNVTTDSLNLAINLLRLIPREMSDDQRNRLLIPNTSNNFSSFSNTLFNDVGARSALIRIPGQFLAHRLVDESLSTTLGLGRLGLKYSKLENSHLDMGEEPVVTVRNNLKQYTSKSFATEFFANAADAGATSFTLMLNQYAPEFDSDAGFLSVAMEKFSSSPSLVAHNNASFTEKDFSGICRTGVGSKRDDQDKIGRFGLGALTMFRFTEVAIIISEDKVVFLDPSKSHLPIPDRAAVIMELEYVRKLYPGQLQAIDGLFGFEINSNEPYHGTIFYLPLRKKSHVQGVSDPIFYEPCSPEVVDKMIKNFRESAPSCLLFTQMDAVQGMSRDVHGNQHILWKHTASRGGPSDSEAATGYSATRVMIENQGNEPNAWIVVRALIPDRDLPDTLKMVNSKRHGAGLALPIGNGPSSPKNSFSFFSTLPLPLSTTLPVHVMGSFILSSDRRQIRLDKHGGLETSYNQWILSDIIPRLYLFLLEHLLDEDIDNSPWWPYHRDDDEKSFLIIEPFYSRHLRDCQRKVFRSSQESTTLAPQEVVLLGDEPDNIKTALSALESTNIVNLPLKARKLAIDYASLPTVNPAFVREEILKDPSAIHSLDISIIESIIQFLSPKTEDATLLLDLQILPLADESSFGTFKPKEDSDLQYYVWRPSHKSSKVNFSPRNFVHHSLKTNELLKMNLNISNLDPSAMVQFIADRLRGVSPLDVDRDSSNWIYDVWESWPEYHRLGLKEEDIATLPLIPTIHPNVFVSLQDCRNGSAVLIGQSSEEAETLRAFLYRMGLRIVRPDGEPTPDSLVEILQNSGYPRLTFEHLLNALSQLSDLPSIHETFEALGEEHQSIFATWARGSISESSNFSGTSLNIAQLLAIWPSKGGSASTALRPSSDLRMLPNSISLEAVGRFMSIFVGEYGKLKAMQCPGLTYDQIADFLECPPILQPEDLIAYKTFLSAWLPTISPNYVQMIQVPNGRCHMVSSDTLYARDDLYRQAFGDDDEKFVHSNFIELEPMLSRHGLQTKEHLNMSIFRICAESINANQEDDLVHISRAEALFSAYSYHLPAKIEANEREIWGDLDGIPFVPRKLINDRRGVGANNDTESGDLPIPEEITSLPGVVSPMELVREEYESIAWSQRAMFKNQPHDRILNAHALLGKPTIQEVLLHLIFLSNNCNNLRMAQRSTMLHDLKATYAYLDKNLSATEHADLLAQMRHENIFLNIMTAAIDEEWQWENADSLVFEIADSGEAYARPVRTFLKAYDRLLRLSGVLRVHYPRYVAPTTSRTEIAKLRSIRSEFNRLRQENVLIDVHFIPVDEQNSQADELAPISAHRVFLAASGGNFSEQFKPGFEEGGDASSDNPIVVKVVAHTRLSIALVIGYLYTGEHSAQQSSLDELLDIMFLSGYWDIKDLFEEIQKIIVERRLIDPLTLEHVCNVAAETNAQALLAVCNDYERQNTEFIQRYRQAAEENV